MFSGSYVAIVTPMNGDGSLDFDSWTRLVDWHAASGTRGIVVGGTTGESATLVDSELAELVERAVALARGRLQVLVGAGTSSTRATVERAAWLSALGVDGLLVVTPAYNKPTQEGLLQHFTAVAQASAVPVMLYNVPGRTAVDMLAPTVARLARLPRIVAIKEALADMQRVRELVATCGEGFSVLSGDDATAREALACGARGVVSVTANLAPAAMSQMVERALAGDVAGAAALDTPLIALHRELFVEANPIPVKWALARMGRSGAALRLPLTELSPRFHDRVGEAMRAANL
jgi:4-hydroxy-tetrahydrodipicolinate synthase